MNISATAAMGYTYTNIKTGVSQKKDVSNENTCEKQTQKEYKNVVKEYKQKHPDSASHVNQQVQAGKNYMKNCGGDEISRSDMTMDEYKAFFKNLMDGVSFDSSQANCKEMWSITEDGWEQMKNDPEYEDWVLGYTIENRSVHFPFQASFLNVEKFGASIEEHHGEGIPMNTESPKKSGKKDESWWSRRQKRMKELMKRQQKAALKRAQERRNVTDIYEENIDIFTESMMGGKNGTEYF